MRAFVQFIATAATAVLLTGCLGNTGSLGGAKPLAGGAAGGAASVDAQDGLPRCEKTLGTIAVDDGRDKQWYRSFGNATQITTIEPLIRLAVQQSNCFVITSIGNAASDSKMSNITDKQRNSGEFRAGSKQQKGQRVAADYYLEPAIIINESPTAGIAGGLGGFLPQGLSSIATNMKVKSAVVTLTAFDIRSGVQLAISEGNATSSNYGAAVGAFGRGGAGTLSGFSKSPEGKATVAAFMDAYSQMVGALQNYQAQDVEGGLGTGGSLQVN